MSLVVRPARAEDVRKYYPDNTSSFRAYVAELDGEVKGMIGLVLTRPIACLVSGFDEELRPHLRSMAIMRAIKKIQQICHSHPGGIIAAAEEGEATAPDILQRLGFSFGGEAEGDQIYIMRRR